MGSVSLKIGDGTARFRRATLCSSAFHLLMLASVLTTNLFALYAFSNTSNSAASSSSLRRASGDGRNLSAISDHVSLILREIEASQRRLRQIERDLAGFDTLDPDKPGLPPELRLFLTPHPLPLGRDARSGLTHMAHPLSHACARAPAAHLLAQFMAYKPHSPCPVTSPLSLPTQLVAKGCEPLPRRRCLTRPARRPAGPVRPVPDSLWNPSSFPKPWFGLDRTAWVKPRSKNDFSVDDVLALGGGARSVRIGFDIGGGVANFAARLAERNVTVVTSTLDVSGRPVSEFVAARGLFPLLLSPAQRFPFYDSVFDLVHIGGALDEGGAPALGKAAAGGGDEALEFLVFDIDRVLRAGGLFWLDNYLCADDERKRTVTRLVERLGYKKLKWVVGEKADGAVPGKTQVYLSAVLQKPART